MTRFLLATFLTLAFAANNMLATAQTAQQSQSAPSEMTSAEKLRMEQAEREQSLSPEERQTLQLEKAELERQQAEKAQIEQARTTRTQSGEIKTSSVEAVNNAQSVNTTVAPVSPAGSAAAAPQREQADKNVSTAPSVAPDAQAGQADIDPVKARAYYDQLRIWIKESPERINTLDAKTRQLLENRDYMELYKAKLQATGSTTNKQ